MATPSRYLIFDQQIVTNNNDPAAQPWISAGPDGRHIVSVTELGAAARSLWIQYATTAPDVQDEFALERSPQISTGAYVDHDLFGSVMAAWMQQPVSGGGDGVDVWVSVAPAFGGTAYPNEEIVGPILVAGGQATRSTR